MRSSIVLILISTLLLASCGSTPDSVTTVSAEKTPFVVEVFTVGGAQAAVSVEKAWRITASSTLTLSAQWAGEIAKIVVRDWQSVKAGALVASLKDTQTNYDLRLAQAENALTIQNAGITTTRINMESAVENARIAYERAKQAYETLTGKNALQYDTVVNANEKTLKGYNETFRTYLADAEKNMTALLYDGDKILGITTNYEYANDAWEPYLGQRAGDTRALAINSWNKTYAARGELRARIEKSKMIDIANLQSDFDLISKSYAQTREFADAMLYMIQNNVIGGGLPQQMQDGWVLTWNGYRSQIGASEWGYNGWRAQTITFFDGYKNTELATKLALASLSRPLTADEMSQLNAGWSDLRITYENTRLTLADAIKNAKLTLEQTDSGYKNAQALKEATLTQLIATKKNAEISLEQARRDYAKLRIIAPVDGVIGKVIGSVGQSVNIGSPVADFTSRLPQIVLDIDSSLASTLSIGDTVAVRVDEVTLSGVVSAVSTVSNANLLSTVRISVTRWEKYIGQSATVVFAPGTDIWGTQVLTLPLDAISIIAEGEGEISIYTTTGAIRQSIKIGKTLWDTMEVLSPLADGTQVITTDMSNYDAIKQNIEKKKL